MEYVANPVIVTAYKIKRVYADPYNESDLMMELEDGTVQRPTSEMLARIKPKKGDYWVIQSDGYIYLNPKDVFERKYSPKP